MATNDDTFRMSPISLLAVIGGLIAFVLVGAITELAWVAAGAAIGGAIGWLIRRFGQDAKTFADAIDLTESSTKSELYDEAKRLEVPGRSAMSRDELAQAVAEHQN